MSECLCGHKADAHIPNDNLAFTFHSDGKCSNCKECLPE